MQGDHTIISFDAAHALRDLCITDEQERLAPPEPVDEQTFHVRMVNSQGLREAASVLIKRMYAWRGYAVDEPHEGGVPNSITMVAQSDGHTVGTMSLCFDSPVGLPADENFKARLDWLREVGCTLCEPTRLAIDTHVPRRVFAAMIHISYIYAHNIHGYSDYVIEVNPRHAMFYKKMLGFTEFGSERLCTRVNAPAVLLRLDLAHMRRQIERFGGMMEKHGTERSYYPYFFSAADEPGITDRLISGRH